ncbi:MAG: hypothetical protein QOH57_4761 [Mycobacterium sp.]|jgi:type VII secretion-associated protein (TIGR03931 family)|nr:hypothetical protein [Mycobacterium sp.]
MALAAIDDDVALIDGHPVAVPALWREVLASTTAGRAVLLVCPSWWSERRVETVRQATQCVTQDVAVARRAVMLARSIPRRPAVVIEIAEAFVALTRPPECQPASVVSREGDPQQVADEAARLVTEPSVVIDRADGVGGAAELGAMILARLRSRSIAVTVIDDDQLLRAAESSAPDADPPRAADGDRAALAAPRYAWRPAVLATGAAVTGVLLVATTALGHRESSSPRTTLLVEGHVVVEVPATWSARRVTAGPGSPRLQVSSPGKPAAAVHITQSFVPKDETLERTADTLRRVVLAQPPGVFVDFDPDDRRVGRPAVTYREIRGDHDIRWAVLLDRDVRISVGCQSVPGSEASVREACERATASARNIGELAGTVAAHP